MSRITSPEIIDLTASASDVPSDGDIDVVEIENPQAAGNPKKAENLERSKRRKRSKKRALEAGEIPETDSLTVSTGGSQASKAQGVQSSTSRNRSHSPAGPRRSSKARPRSPSRSKAQDDLSDLFYVDVLPQPLPTSIENPSKDPTSHLEPKLLLPTHVSVIETASMEIGSIEIIRPPSLAQDENDFIEYLDYNDQIQGGAVRYFDEHKDEKPATFICKNCRAQGQHRTFECPVQICLTCGARNEHATRSCPISKICFKCGLKGHLLQNCPNARSSVIAYGCDRCGRSSHKTKECPTWWRIYEYVSDEARLKTMQDRESRQGLESTNDGEVLVGSEPACYQCGGSGHWGDDCNEISAWDPPQEPSAFSAHNVTSGPFFDPAKEPSGYQASYQNDLPEGWGADAPSNVGRQGRKKDQAKMEQRMREQEGESDGDNWFTNPRNASNRATQPASLPRKPPPPPTGPKKMSFGLSIKDAARQFQPPSAPRRSLLDRIDVGHNGQRDNRQGSSRDNHSKQDSLHKRKRDDSHSNGKARHDGDAGGRNRDRSGDRDRNSGRERDRGRGGSKGSEDPYRRHTPGPRYSGGYSR